MQTFKKVLYPFGDEWTWAWLEAASYLSKKRGNSSISSKKRGNSSSLPEWTLIQFSTEYIDLESIGGIVTLTNAEEDTEWLSPPPLSPLFAGNYTSSESFPFFKVSLFPPSFHRERKPFLKCMTSHITQ